MRWSAAWFCFCFIFSQAWDERGTKEKRGKKERENIWRENRGGGGFVGVEGGREDGSWIQLVEGKRAGLRQVHKYG